MLDKQTVNLNRNKTVIFEETHRSFIVTSYLKFSAGNCN